VVFNTKIGNVGLSTHDLEQDPLLVNSNLETLDGHLQARSPAIDSGLPVGSLGGLVPDNDLEGNTRPAGSGVDRGAYEYGGGQPTRDPVPDIKANGSDGPVTLPSSQALSITIALDPGTQGGEAADWWIAASSPFGWYHYAVTEGALSWLPDLCLTHQGPLFAIPGFQVLNIPQSLPGTYVFYFGIDMDENGSLDTGHLHYDSVQVNVR
jgi:hypothetical protein